jgi:hypothetical protein
VDVPTLLSLISTTAIVGGLVFAGLQVRIAQRERSKNAQMVLAANAFFDEGFMDGVQLILDLPDGLTRAQMVEHLHGDESGLIHWLGRMEGLGFLVFQGALPLAIVDHGASGPIVLSWRKLEGLVREERALTERDSWWEWFEWLVDRITEFEAATPRIAAHIRHRDWRP